MIKTKLQKFETALFYLIIFLIPFQLRKSLYLSGDIAEWGSAFLYITDCFLIVLFFMWWLRERNKEGVGPQKFFSLKKRKIFYLTGLFLLSGLVSVIYAENKILGLWQWIKIVEVYFFIYYIRDNLKWIKKEKIMSFFVSCMVFQGVVGIVQFFTQKSVGLNFLGEASLSPEINGVAKIIFENTKAIRAYGLFPHPNIFAVFLVIALFFLFYIFLQKAERERSFIPKLPVFDNPAFFIIAFFILALALLLTFSRATITAFVVFAFFYFLYLLANQEIRYTLRPLTFFLFFIVVVNFLFLVSVFSGELYGRFNISPAEQSVTLRYFYNRIALDEIKEKPFFGEGPGNFVISIPRGKALERSIDVTVSSLNFDGGDFVSATQEKWIFQPVHNVYLLIASEFGLIGFSLFIFILLYSLFGLIKKIKFKEVSLDLEEKEIKDICLNVFKLTMLFILFIVLFVLFFDHFFWTSQQGRLLIGVIIGLVAAF